ncbi:hypothetical protein ACQKWADRAFT_314306 [Trichoderma austrokoningii]
MEMKFVDVTERTTQGARSGKKKLKDASKGNSPRSYSSSLSSSSSSSSQPALGNAVVRHERPPHELLPFPTFNFSIPPESVAQVFFFRHYSITGSIRLYEMQNSPAMSALKMMGIVAVGMAGLAISKQDPGVMALARRKYGSTLLSINEAIKIRSEVVKESTVAAVTLMARFEIIACQDPFTQEGWICHLQGAAIMLRHWTQDDWDKVTNPQSPRTFLHFFYMMAMGWIIQRMPVLAHIREIVRSSPLFRADAELEPATHLFNIVCRLADLHSSSNGRGQANRVAEKIATAMAIETELLAWESDLPEEWTYSHAENKLDAAYGPSCHVYACPWQSYIWSHYRICRCITHAVLQQSLDTFTLPVTEAHPALIEACDSQKEASRVIQAAMMREFRASMPYILDFYDKSKGSSNLFRRHSGVFGLLASIQAMMGVADVCERDAGWLLPADRGLRLLSSSCVVGRPFASRTRRSTWPSKAARGGEDTLGKFRDNLRGQLRVTTCVKSCIKSRGKFRKSSL